MSVIHYFMVFEDSGVLSGGGTTGYPGQNGVVTTQTADGHANPLPVNLHSMIYPDINDGGDAATPGGNLIQAQQDAQTYAQQYLRRVLILKVTDNTVAFDSADPTRFASTVDKQTTEPIFNSEKFGTGTIPVVMTP